MILPSLLFALVFGGYVPEYEYAKMTVDEKVSSLETTKETSRDPPDGILQPNEDLEESRPTEPGQPGQDPGMVLWANYAKNGNKFVDFNSDVVTNLYLWVKNLEQRARSLHQRVYNLENTGFVH